MLKTVSLQQFITDSKSKRIIAIGAGRKLERFLQEYDVKVFCAIDSDKEKQGAFIDNVNYRIPIESWEYLYDNIQSTDILLVTPVLYDELYIRVINDKRLKDNDVHVLDVMMRLQYDINRMNIIHKPIEFRQHEKKLIPKIIHFFWFSGDPFPEDVQRCIDSWKKFCPDYELRKWDLTNYDYKKNKFATEAIEKRKWAFASDYGRADVVYQYGGIYLDIDVELTRNIDDLLYHDAFIGFEDSKYVDPGSGFGAAPGNPVIKGFRDVYEDMSFVLPDGSWNIKPAPNHYTKVLDNYGLVRNGEYQLLDSIAIYPYYSFCPHSYVTDRTYMDKDTYSVHHHAGGWLDKKEYLLKQEMKDAII